MKQSGTINKRRQKSIETKERIFSAALSLIEEYGYEDVQMDDIAERASVSSGLFYNYFVSKADVLTEAFLSRSAIHYKKIYTEYLTGSRGLEKLFLFIHHIVDLRKNVYSKEELRYHHGNLLIIPEKANAVVASSQQLFDTISEALTEAQQDGDICPQADLKEATEAISLILRGATWEYLVTEGEYDFENKVQKLVKVYLNGINYYDRINPALI